MNIVKRVFNLKRLFALAMIIAMMSTLSISGLTFAAGDKLWVKPLNADYYIENGDLSFDSPGAINDLGNSNFKLKNNSIYAEIVDGRGKMYRKIFLPNESIEFEQLSEHSILLKPSVALEQWLWPFRYKFASLNRQVAGEINLIIYVSMENSQGEVISILEIGKISVKTSYNWGEDRESDIDFVTDDLRPRKRKPLKNNVDPLLNGESGFDSVGWFVSNASVSNKKTSRPANIAPVDPNFDIDSFFAVNSDEVVLGKKRAVNKEPKFDVDSFFAVNSDEFGLVEKRARN